MKSLKHFFVEVPEKTHGTITVGGKELFLDARFNEFEHRVCYGRVVSTPVQVETGVKKGDTLFFHHHVTKSDNLRIDDGIYMAVLDLDNPRGSHAIAYRDSKGELHMLADWVFLEPLEEEGDEEVTDAGIVVVSLEEKKELEARIVTPSQYMVEQGVKKGDVVGFLPDRDYKMKLDDDSIVYRMTDDDVLYVRN